MKQETAVFTNVLKTFVATELKELGYDYDHSRTFRKSSEPTETVHIINFQLGVRWLERKSTKTVIPMFRIDNKVAIVTGAARGLGAAIARTLAKQGARVAAADINFEEVEKVATEIGNDSKAYAADVSNVTQIKSLVENV